MIIIQNDFSKQIEILTEKQKEFLSLPRDLLTGEAIDYLRLQKGDDDYAFPKAMHLQWQPKVQAKVLLSEFADLREPIEFYGNEECAIDNLKSNTTYFLQVVSQDDASKIYSFKTEDSSIRFLRVDGITNVRDLGGKSTLEGKYVRQGLLYRGSEMNSHVTITDEGLQTLRKVLKLKTVLDLRGASEEVANVYNSNYAQIPVLAYEDIFKDGTPIKKIFDLFSNEENYPIYFHCWGGADRTGTIAFLVGALLGEDLTTLFDDYEITTLSVWGTRARSSPNFVAFLNHLESFEGDALRQKVQNYLLSIGVTNAQMDSIRNIMLIDGE